MLPVFLYMFLKQFSMVKSLLLLQLKVFFAVTCVHEIFRPSQWWKDLPSILQSRKRPLLGLQHELVTQVQQFSNRCVKSFQV